MSNDSAIELTHDLRWFLLPELLFQPEIANTRIEAARAALRPQLPCLIRDFDRLDRKAAQAGAKAVRDRMKRLGFFGGKLKTRPPERILQTVAGAKTAKGSVPATAARISVFVYTDPTPKRAKRRPTDNDCIRSNETDRKIDCVLCASRFEAQRLARQAKGKAIAIPQTADIGAFWRRLDSATKGKQIAQLFVFGHGFPDGVRIGDDQLKTGSEVPIAFQQCRFAQGAQIRFFGCSVAGRDPWGPESFMREIGTALLCRGGSVTAFTTFVEVECSRERGFKIYSDKADPVTIRIAGCDPKAVLARCLKVLDQFVAKGEKAI